ncbi:MAG: hypothetical protein ACW99A_11530 [Candidatus Kariarchaeaceae archaeon]|jgi:hypothetical protein
MESINKIGKDKINSIIEEAEVNYKTGRYENAAKNFEYLSRTMFDQRYFEDMLYFSYRSIIARKQFNDVTSIVKNMHKLALDILRVSTHMASEHLNETVIHEDKTELIWIAQYNLKLLGDHEKRLLYIRALSKIYLQLAADIEFKFEERKSYLERNMIMLEEIKEYKGYKSGIEKLAALIEEKAEQTLDSQGFDTNLVAARFYVEAATHFFQINNMNKYEELTAKARKLDPNLKMHQLTKDDQIVPILN